MYICSILSYSVIYSSAPLLVVELPPLSVYLSPSLHHLSLLQTAVIMQSLSYAQIALFRLTYKLNISTESHFYKDTEHLQCSHVNFGEQILVFTLICSL